VGAGTPWETIAPQCRGELVANPVSGDFALVGIDTLGAVCALSYHTRHGTLAPLAAATAITSGATALLDVAYDPFQNVAVAIVSTAGGTNLATTLSLGAMLRFRTAPLTVGQGFEPSAAAIDMGEGSVPVLAQSCTEVECNDGMALAWVPG